MIKIDLPPDWLAALKSEFEKPYFGYIKQFLEAEMQAGKIIYPSAKNIFRAFEQTPLDELKVVILGQDPYHGPGQAQGMSFSVPNNCKIPPSLRNIHKELHIDLGIDIPDSGDLTPWTEQGVFLLNATLTVEHKSPNSHSQIGWQTFTDRVIEIISARRERVVFLLWGKFAQSKAELIDTQKHLILKATHPSPFSAHNGFFGCRHFSKANRYLIEHGFESIAW